MYKSLSDVQSAVKTVFDGHRIIDSKTLQSSVIDEVIYAAVFADDETVKTEARRAIRTLAHAYGACSASIYGLYQVIGNGKVSNIFTVPAFNVRTLTYDTARSIFRLANETKTAAFVFEIARSEIDYTDQQPDEYAVSVLAAAVKEGYVGPVFLQGDHYQFSAKKYKENPPEEMEKIKALVKKSIEADFQNIDIDASTLVDLEKADLKEQQHTNSQVTSLLTSYIRSLEQKGQTISIGAEIGHIGGKNSTAEDLQAFMDNYLKMKDKHVEGIAKISVQTGTSHGGIPLADGTIASVKLDFSVLENVSTVARTRYHVGGAVQHGASTLPNELFNEFPKHKTLEIHLATGFQNIVYDNIPNTLREKMYAWVEENCKKEWEEGWNKDQFIYKTRKKALGPFKKELWMLSEKEKQPIMNALSKQFRFLFDKLGVNETKSVVDTYVSTSHDAH